MITIKFNISDNVIKKHKEEFITTGSFKQIECEFNFLDADWIGLEIMAIFVINDLAYSSSLNNNKCYIPAEALENDGDLFVGVFGTKIEGNSLIKRNTTNLQNIKVYEGSFVKAMESKLPTPSTFELYIIEMQKLLEKTKSIVDNFSAVDVKFKDGDSFQDKYDSGELRGPVGPQGLQGVKGNQGDIGIQGPQGIIGPQGIQGATGPIGPKGLQGPQGIKGDVGEKGDIGPRGPIGLIGPQGPQGIQGERGVEGLDGPRGIQGIQGPKGDRGDTGPQGPTGTVPTKSSISVYKNSDGFELPKGAAEFNFDKIKNSEGSKFSFTNNRITFNSSFKIKIECQIWINSFERSYLLIRLIGVTIVANGISKDPCGFNKLTAISPIIEVKSGDYLKCEINSDGSGSMVNRYSDSVLSSFMNVYEV